MVGQPVETPRPARFEPAAADAGGAATRRCAAALLAGAPPGSWLPFPRIQAAVQEHGLSRHEIPVLLRELLDSGVRIPPALVPVAAPASAANRREDPATARTAPTSCVRLLDGTESLDISRISLTDLGLAPTAATVHTLLPCESISDPRKSLCDTTASTSLTSAATDGDPDETVDGPSAAVDPAGDGVARRHVRTDKGAPLLTAEQEVELARQIEAGVFAQERLDRGEPLSPDLERDLRQIAECGRRSFEAFVTANLRLVVSIAGLYAGRGLPMPDLVQEGNLGLIRAVQKFDFTHGTKFSTYATWWIRQSISRGLAEQARTIRYPVHRVDALNRVLDATRRLQDVGATVDTAVVAAEAGMSEGEVRDLLGLPRTVSLDDLMDTLGENLPGALTYECDWDADQGTEMFGFDVDDVHRALRCCDERERHVIWRRFGFAGEPATLEAIGRELGVTRERVRQIEKRATARVRSVLTQRQQPVAQPTTPQQRSRQQVSHGRQRPCDHPGGTDLPAQAGWA